MKKWMIRKTWLMPKLMFKAFKQTLCRWLFLSIALFGFSIGCNAQVHWQQPDYILQAFLEVALKNEFKESAEVVRKWQAPIKVHMVYEYPNAQKYQYLVHMHLAHLQAITQHPIQMAVKPEEANLTVVLTTENHWEQQYLKQYDTSTQQQMRTTVCMGRMQLTNVHEIIRGVVVVPVDRAVRHRKLVTCIVEELTQMMGLPNDSEKVYPSVFNDRTPNDLLTGLDFLLLRLLYHPDVKSNMNAESLNDVLPAILKAWQRLGLIQSATQEVRQGELYPLLGF